MKTFRFLTLLFILSCMQLPAQLAQQDSAALKLYSFVENINAFTDFYPQEKVYLHFDNSSYFLGETMWFKCYVSIAEQNTATDVSRTLYVELLTPEGRVVDARKLMVENGQCHGEFLLSDKSMYSGFYQVRAYTRYMLNFGDDCIFSRVFPIYDKPKEAGNYTQVKMTGNQLALPNDRKSINEPEKINIAFFPEGGNLVQGVGSKVAFKITDENGMGIDAEGTVYNSRKEVVATFKSARQGMGYFYLLPDGKEYQAEIVYNGGKKHNEKLPLAEAEGYVMTLDNRSKDDLLINLQKNGTVSGAVAVSATCRGKVNSFAAVDLNDKNVATVKFPLANMETGVNEITLYDTEGRIWCDRLVFVNHDNKWLYINKTQDKEQYSPFEKVSMNFEITDTLGRPVATDFSLSIRDAGTTITTTYDDNVMTNMLLSSDLKGYIENPRYYFEKDDDQHKADLDLLMLTQGWRRYIWRQMAGLDYFRLKHQAEKGILIDGVVKTYVRKQSKEGVDVAIVLKNDSLGMLFEEAKTNEQGYFSAYAKDIKGSWDLVMQTKEKNKKKDYQVMLNRLFGPVAFEYAGYETKLASNSRYRERRIIEDTATPIDTIDTGGEIALDTTGLTMETRDHLLPTVTIAQKKKYTEQKEDLSKTGVIYTVEKEMDAIADAGDYVGDNVVEFLLRTNRNFVRFGGPSYYYNHQPVLFLVDNKPLGLSAWSDIDMVPLNEIDTVIIADSRNIARILTAKGDIDLSVTGFQQVEDNEAIFSLDNGATKTQIQTHNADDPELAVFKTSRLRDRIFVLLYTYPGDHFRPERKSIRRTTLQGYDYTREFYSPKYDYAVFPDETDYRRTLYWNPNVKTDETGKANVSFYNNSTSRRLTIDAETMNPSGMFGVYAE